MELYTLYIYILPSSFLFDPRLVILEETIFFKMHIFSLHMIHQLPALPDVLAVHVHTIACRQLRPVLLLQLLLHSVVSFLICCLCSLHTIMSAWSQSQHSHTINTPAPKPTFTVTQPHSLLGLIKKPGYLHWMLVDTSQKILQQYFKI